MSRCITQMSLRLVTLGSSRWDVVWWVGFWDVGVCMYKWRRCETWGSMSFFGTMYTAWIYRHLMQATFQKLQGWVFLTEETCDFHLQSYMAMQNDYLPHIGEGFGGPFLTMTQTQSQELQRAAQKLITGRSRAEVSRKALCIGIYRHTCTCINCVNTYIKLYLLKPKKSWIIVWCNRESSFGVMWYVQHLLTSPVVVF